MNEYIITYNQNMYRRKHGLKLTIQADSIEDCKDKLRKEHNLNPFYLRINGVGIDD